MEFPEIPGLSWADALTFFVVEELEEKTLRWLLKGG